MRLTILLAVAMAACSPYSPDLPYAPFFCGSGNPQCPDGYACNGSDGSGHMVCQQTGGKAPDAGNPNAMCANDSAVETQHGANNDTIATAYQVPDLTMRPMCMLPFAGLSICPMGDVDNYAIVLSGQYTLEADMTYESWGAPLSGSILNSGGTPIVNMSPAPGMTDTLKAVATNLPAGQYYVKIYGPSSAPAINNYALTLTLSAGTGCP